LDPWDKADLVMVNDLSDMLLNLICHYFIEDFQIDVHSGLACSFSFWMCPCPVLGLV
jgi:hypothetical protein